MAILFFEDLPECCGQKATPIGVTEDARKKYYCNVCCRVIYVSGTLREGMESGRGNKEGHERKNCLSCG